jgi:uncharacterized protein (TIGR02391 family)
MTIQAKNKIPCFDPTHLEAIAKILADTNNGLSGTQLAQALLQTKIPDTSPDQTKWKRLFNAFVEFQNKHQIGNHVVKFTEHVMSPASYISRSDVFKSRLQELNAVLAFAGMEIKSDGRFRRIERTFDLDTALSKSNKLKASLQQRNVHSDIFKFCTVEILAQNYFHAVFEAMKSVTSKLRTISGFSTEGADLVQQALSLGKNNEPKCAINKLATETEIGEQRGFVNLLIGMYGTIRNPLGHNPRIEWNMSEQDALDMLTMISLVHRKLDAAYLYKKH